MRRLSLLAAVSIAALLAAWPGPCAAQRGDGSSLAERLGLVRPAAPHSPANGGTPRSPSSTPHAGARFGAPSKRPPVAAGTPGRSLPVPSSGAANGLPPGRPVYQDRQVLPSAAANPVPGPNRSRTAAGSPATLKSRFSRLWGGGSDDSPQRNSTAGAPLPYEATAARPSSPGSATPPGASVPRTAAQRTPTRPVRQQPPLQQQQPRPTQEAVLGPINQPPRRSPAESVRRNELAEALSGLNAVTPPAPKPPAVATDDQLPAYLQGLSDDAVADDLGGLPGSAEGRPAPPRDLHDALAPVGAVRRPVAATATDAPPTDRESRGAAASTSTSRRPRATPTPDLGAVLADEAPIPRQDATATDGPSVGTLPAENVGRSEASTAAAAPPASTRPQAQGPRAGAARRTVAADLPAAPRIADIEQSARRLLDCEQPLLKSHVVGPRRVVVGLPFEYQIELENDSDTLARDVVATIEAPVGLEIVDATASSGVVERSQPTADSTAATTQTITWQLYELNGGSKQSLTLRVVPRGGRDAALAIRWTHAPAGGQAVVEVQEPKIRMEISGPGEALFGQPQRYALVLSNPGTGTAEEVVIALRPPGGDDQSIVRHKVGALAAGDTKRIELELTARQVGELQMHASATAVGGLQAETEKTVRCLRAALEVDWRGPEKQYAGSVATYFLRVRNSGTAAAQDVAVKAALPEGAELVDSSEGALSRDDGRETAWQIGAMNAGEERFMQLQCQFTKAGVNPLAVTAISSDQQVRDEKTASVTVVALADLKLDVVDPKGAAPVGKSATYEIRIKNRGLTAARGVKVVAMFSQGIEPRSVEGGPHNIRDGRVAFGTIDNLAAGAEAVLRIQAVAAEAGTHVFRAEVLCEDLETKLAAEETTRYFVEENRWDDASTAYAEEDETVKR